MNTNSSGLRTTYLGLPLRTPIIPSASPLSANLANLEEMERCGAGAVVFPTLFEEPITANPILPEDYCKRISAARKKLEMPVIASVSATTAHGWTQLARQIEEAGASALELNIYEANVSTSARPGEIESKYIETVQRVVAAVRIPVSVKLPPFFTNIAYLTKEMEEAGAKGFVLFNRFYLPDIDLGTLTTRHALKLSSPTESRHSLRWISLLYYPIQADLVANTGIRTGEDVLKMVLAGAAAAEVCAILMERGVAWLAMLVEELKDALGRTGFASIEEARGRLAHKYTEQTGVVEREEYRSALQGYEHCDVPTWRESAESATREPVCTFEN